MQSSTKNHSLSLPLPDLPLLLNLNEVLAHFQRLSDTRSARGIRHPLGTTLFITLLGLLSGQNTPTAIAHWAACRTKALCRWLDLKVERVPSRFTLARLLGQVVTVEELAHSITGLLKHTLSKEIAARGELVVAIDGKTLRGTLPVGQTKGVHLMAAYLPNSGVVLAQVEVESKQNEIVAAPQLLSQLDLRGMVVTGDAMQCQRELSALVVKSAGEYVWTLKGNQPQMLEDVTRLFESEPLAKGASASEDDFTVAQSWDCEHGRIERRQLRVSSMLDEDYTKWPYLSQSFKLERWVWSGYKDKDKEWDEARYEVSYGISSLTGQEASAARLMTIIRAHWGIENGLHRRRDVTMGEDGCQTRKGHFPHVLAWLRNLVIGLIVGGGQTNLAAGRRDFDWWLSCQLVPRSS